MNLYDYKRSYYYIHLGSYDQQIIMHFRACQFIFYLGTNYHHYEIIEY